MTENVSIRLQARDEASPRIREIEQRLQALGRDPIPVDVSVDESSIDTAERRLQGLGSLRLVPSVDMSGVLGDIGRVRDAFQDAVRVDPRVDFGRVERDIRGIGSLLRRELQQQARVSLDADIDVSGSYYGVVPGRPIQPQGGKGGKGGKGRQSFLPPGVVNFDPDDFSPEALEYLDDLYLVEAGWGRALQFLPQAARWSWSQAGRPFRYLRDRWEWYAGGRSRTGELVDEKTGRTYQYRRPGVAEEAVETVGRVGAGGARRVVETAGAVAVGVPVANWITGVVESAWDRVAGGEDDAAEVLEPETNPRSAVLLALDQEDEARRRLRGRTGLTDIEARLSQLGRVTGLTNRQGAQYLEFLTRGDPRLADEAAELYLHYYRRQLLRPGGGIPDKNEVLQEIFESLFEEGAAYTLAEQGGLHRQFAERLALPRLQGEFSAALGLHPSITVPFDDVVGGVGLGRSITVQALEGVVQDADVSGDLIGSILANQKGQAARALERVLQTKLEENVRARTEAAYNKLVQDDYKGALEALRGLDISPDLLATLEAADRFTALTREDFTRTQQLLTPFAGVPGAFRRQAEAGVDLLASQEGRLRLAEDLSLRAEDRVVRGGYGDRLAASVYNELDVVEEVRRATGLTAGDLYTIGSTDRAGQFGYLDEALERLEAGRLERLRASQAELDRQTLAGVDRYDLESGFGFGLGFADGGYVALGPAPNLGRTQDDFVAAAQERDRDVAVRRASLQRRLNRAAEIPDEWPYTASDWDYRLGQILREVGYNTQTSQSFSEFGGAVVPRAGGIVAGSLVQDRLATLGGAWAGPIGAGVGYLAGAATERLLEGIYDSLTTGDGWLARLVGRGDGSGDSTDGVAEADAAFWGTARLRSSRAVRASQLTSADSADFAASVRGGFSAPWLNTDLNGRAEPTGGENPPVVLNVNIEKIEANDPVAAGDQLIGMLEEAARDGRFWASHGIGNTQ